MQIIPKSWESPWGTPTSHEDLWFSALWVVIIWHPLVALCCLYVHCTAIIRFFSSKISSKKYSRKIIFGQTKLNENNFTSRLWWALIEETTPCAEEVAGEKEIACCVRGHVYLDIWGAAIREVLVCSTEPTNVRKFSL